MRAVVVSALGGPEVLEVREVSEPQPGPGQVAIEVAYASINYADVMARRGDYAHSMSLPFVPGLEVAGTIRAVGSGVAGLHSGQAVAAITGTGGYAEVALAPAALTFPLAGIELSIAATVPAVGATAIGLLCEVARLRPDESLLVHAAAGGVGTFVGQLARYLKAGLVLGTVGSSEKITYAQRFGYDHVLVRDSFVPAVGELTGGKGVDVVLESIGGQVFAEGRSVLAPFGRLIEFGNASGNATERVSAQDLRATNTALMGFSFGDLSRRAPERLAALVRQAFALVGNGTVRIDITDILPLDHAAEAHRRLENRATIGKLLLEVGSDSLT